MELAFRVAQEVGNVSKALGVLHAAHRALIGESPEVALVAEQGGSRRRGIGGRVCCLGARDRGLRNCLDTTAADLRTLRSQRLGALDPAWHPHGLELLARDIEECPCLVAIPERPAPDFHPGLV